MRVQYYLADGQEIDFETGGPIPTVSDISYLAYMYAQKRPNDLPDSVFVNVRLYREFISQFYTAAPIYVKPSDGVQLLQIQTGVGPLIIYPMPMASDAKLFLVGKREDYNRYDLDRVFEETVLKDNERI